MKIVIVGGTSSLGSALKPFLAEFSNVVTAGRNNCDITLDLNDPLEKIILPENTDVIIHTAANFGGESIEEMIAAENTNVLGTLKLCQASVKANVKHFILVSSMSACLNKDSKYYSIYALSKLQSEEIAKFYCYSHSLALTILRPSQIYSNDISFSKHQPFLYKIIENAEKGLDVTIYGSNDPVRNYIHADDLSKIVIKVIQKKVEGTFSCMHPSNNTFSQIAKAAFKAFNTNGNIKFLQDKEDIPNNVFEKDDLLYKLLDFYPEISIDYGMKKIAMSKGIYI